jgi:FMN phosphatase YigB (HAD superfamily)
MDNDIKITKPVSYGYANSWKEVPGIIKECREKRKEGLVHDFYSNDVGRCLTEYGCRTCGYVYKVDSSD